MQKCLAFVSSMTDHCIAAQFLYSFTLIFCIQSLRKTAAIWAVQSVWSPYSGFTLIISQILPFSEILIGVCLAITTQL